MEGIGEEAKKKIFEAVSWKTPVEKPLNGHVLPGNFLVAYQCWILIFLSDCTGACG